MAIGSSYVKRTAAVFGADLCGIASADRFKDAPQGHHPRDILHNCRSVVVLARKSPPEIMNGGPDLYTRARDRMALIMDTLAAYLAEDLKSGEVSAIIQKFMGPGRVDGSSRYRDLLSLKHAAELAGLGRIGRNTLLVNDRFGNMIWLSAVLTSLELEPDPPADYEACLPGCVLCRDACPVRALDGELMAQRSCYEFAHSRINGNEKISCWACRRVCPRSAGIPV